MGSLQKIVLMIGREIPDETHSKEPFRNPYVFTNSINWREAALADTKALLEERREERSKPVHLQNTYDQSRARRKHSEDPKGNRCTELIRDAKHYRKGIRNSEIIQGQIRK